MLLKRVPVPCALPGPSCRAVGVTILPLIEWVADSYNDLVVDLRRRVPVHAPEWSDTNASDPGITMLDLLAFLGEDLLYRFNQIPAVGHIAKRCPLTKEFVSARPSR